MKQNVLFYDRLYLGESVYKKKEKIKKMMKKRKLQPNVFAITMPLCNEGLLEIYKSMEFLQKVYDNVEIEVVGLAGSMQEAFGMVESIVTECYFTTGGFDIKKYLNERQGCLL